jgi:hypothetical protein
MSQIHSHTPASFMEAAESLTANNHPRENGGVFLEGIPNTLNPIRGRVENLGSLTLVSEALFVGRRSSDTARLDRIYQIELDGYTHAIRETQPETSEDTGITFTHFPGFSEIIEAGSAKTLHESVAAHMPGVRVISVASDGIGPTGEKLTRENYKDHGVNEMAERRLKLLKALCGDEPVIANGTSMGSVLVAKMLLEDANTGHNLNAFSSYYASAIVEPSKTRLFMATLFPVSMMLDTPREVIRMAVKRSPSSLSELAAMLEHRRGDSLAMVIQAATLLGGMAVHEITKVSREYRGGLTISGQFDPLAQFGMWRELKRGHDLVHIQSVPLRGHGMAADGEGGGQKIASSLQRWQVPELLAA